MRHCLLSGIPQMTRRLDNKLAHFKLAHFGQFGSGELWAKIPIPEMREIAATKAYTIGRRAVAAEILSRSAGDRGLAKT